MTWCGYHGDPVLVCPGEVEEGRQGEVREGVAHEPGRPQAQLPHARPAGGWVWPQHWRAGNLQGQGTLYIMTHVTPHHNCTWEAIGAGFSLLSRQPHSGSDITWSKPLTNRASAPGRLVAMAIKTPSMASMSDSSF